MDNDKQKEELKELKESAGQFAKAAGHMAGSLGKLAYKKGTELKEKLSDEEFQEKTKENISDFANKTKETITAVADKTSELAHKASQIENDNYSSRADRRTAKKEEKARLKEEKKEAKKAEQKKWAKIGIIFFVIVLVIGIVGGVISEKNGFDEYYTDDSEYTEDINLEDNDEDEEVVDVDMETYVGMTCYKADPQIKDLGYEPTYLAENTGDDLTGEIESGDTSAKAFTIYSVEDVDDDMKTVEFLVQSKRMKKQKNHQSKIESQMKDHQAISIVQMHGETMFTGFKLKQVFTSAKVKGNGWDIYGPCTYKVYGEKVKGECVAHVNAKTEDVEEFVVR